MIRKWDIVSEEQKKQCIEELLTRIDEQDGAEFGVIAAQEIIDIVAAYLGPSTYNLAIEDARKTIQNKLADIDIDLDTLKTVS